MKREKNGRRYISLVIALALLAALMLCGSALAEAKTLRLPEDLTIIEEQAFYDVKAIKEVVLPGGILEIGSKAFANSTLTTINLPKTIEHIAENAFSNSRLSAVYAEPSSYAYDWAVDHGYDVHALSPVISLSTSNGTVINVDWEPVEDAVDYYIEYSTNNFIDENYVSRYTEDTEYTLGGMKPGTKYYIRVGAFNERYEEWHDSKVKTITTGKTTKQIPISNISLFGESGDSVFMGRCSVGQKDDEAKNEIVIEPVSATNQQLNWTSSNTKVATVNKTTGVITGVSIGVTKITATATDGSGVSISGNYYVGPKTPTGVKVAVSGTTLTVTWNAAAGAECYWVNVYAEDVDDNFDIDNITGTRKCVIKNLASNTEYMISVGSGADSGEEYGIIYGVSAESVLAQTGYSSAAVPVREIQFNEWSVELEQGQTYNAAPNVIVQPNYANNKNVTWKSDNTSVAKVNANTGVVTAVAGGMANITATAADGSGVEESFQVYVTDYALTVDGGNDQAWLDYTTAASTKTFTVTSGMPWTATSDSSWLTTSISGDTLTVRTAANTASEAKERTGIVTISNEVNSATITVVQTCIKTKLTVTTSPALSTSAFSPTKMTAQNLTFNVSGYDASSRYLYRTLLKKKADGSYEKLGSQLWDKNSSFTMTPNGKYGQYETAGTYMVKVYEKSTLENKYGQWDYQLPDSRCVCFYFTIEANVAVTGVTLNTMTTSMDVGSTAQMRATVEPSNATDKTVTWISSDESVATVDPGTGLVTAVAKGKATITAIANDSSGAQASCEVNVVLLAKSLYWVETEVTMTIGETRTISCKIAPVGVSNNNVSFSSSDTTILSKSGWTFTALKEGTTLLTITTKDGTNLSAQCVVTVVPAEEPSFTITHKDLAGETLTMGAAASAENNDTSTLKVKSNKAWTATLSNTTSGFLKFVNATSSTATVSNTTTASGSANTEYNLCLQVAKTPADGTTSTAKVYFKVDGTTYKTITIKLTKPYIEQFIKIDGGDVVGYNDTKPESTVDGGTIYDQTAYYLNPGQSIAHNFSTDTGATTVTMKLRYMSNRVWYTYEKNGREVASSVNSFTSVNGKKTGSISLTIPDDIAGGTYMLQTWSKNNAGKAVSVLMRIRVKGKNNDPVAVKTSQAGIAFIKSWEGCRLYVYNDGDGNPTIGWGHLIQAGESFTTITQEEADVLFLKDLSRKEATTNSFINLTGIKPTQRQYDALSSFFYNGNGGALNSNTDFYKVFANNKYNLEAIDDKEVYKRFAAFCNPGSNVQIGLFKRRCDEARIFLEGIYTHREWTIPSWVKNGQSLNESWYPVELDSQTSFAPAYPPVVINQNDYNNTTSDLYYKCGRTDCNNSHVGYHTIADAGCGLCSIVNAVRYLTGNVIDVHDVAQYARNSYGYTIHDGTNWQFYVDYASKYGNTYGFYREEVTDTLQGYKNFLNAGGVIIAGCFRSDGRSGGHVLVIADYDSNTDKFLILDSAGTQSGNKIWTGNLYGWYTMNTDRHVLNGSVDLIRIGSTKGYKRR